MIEWLRNCFSKLLGFYVVLTVVCMTVAGGIAGYLIYQAVYASSAAGWVIGGIIFGILFGLFASINVYGIFATFIHISKTNDEMLKKLNSQTKVEE